MAMLYTMAVFAGAMIFCFGTGFCLKKREDGQLAAIEFVKARNAKVAFESNDNDDGFMAAQ